MKHSDQLQVLMKKSAGWAAAAAYLTLGVIFLINAALARALIIYISAGAAAVLGIFGIIRYFRRRPLPHSGRYPLAAGLALLAFAASALLMPQTLLSVTMFVIGLAVTATGFVWLQQAFDVKRFGAQKWWLYLIAAALSVIFGLLTLLVNRDPGMPAFSPVLQGILLVTEAVISIALMLCTRKIEDRAAAARPVPDASARPAGSAPAEAPASTEAPVPADAPVSPAPSASPLPEAPHSAPSLPREDVPPEASDAPHAPPELPFDQPDHE